MLERQVIFLVGGSISFKGSRFKMRLSVKNGTLIRNGQLTGQCTLLEDGSFTKIWMWFSRGCLGKSVETSCSELSLVANISTLSPRDLMRSPRVLSGPTGSGSISC